MRHRFPVAARLTTILAGVALSTLALASVVDDRALSLGLGRAAEQRLEIAARATERLVAEHLNGLGLRYAGVSRTPELRANLEHGAGPTLQRFAASLVERSGASAVVFLDASGRTQARHGAASHARELEERWREASEDVPCVEIEGAKQEGGAAPEVTGLARRFAPCTPSSASQAVATLIAIGGVPHAAVSLPLTTGSRAVGRLVVAEPVGQDLLAVWSELTEARIDVVPHSASHEGPLRRTALRFGGSEVRVSSSLAPEMETLRESRRSKVLAGLVSILIALGLSALAARDFLRPIHEIQRAAEAVGRGDLEVRIGSTRGDEIGDVARVLDQTLERLRFSRQRLQHVQRVARFGDWSFDVEADAVEGSAEFQSALDLSPGGRWRMSAVLRRFPSADRARLHTALRRCRHFGTAIDLHLCREAEPGASQIFHVRAARRVGPRGETLVEGSLHDVTERHRAEEQIRFLAFHDGLTGLPNRRFLNERLALAVSPGQPRGFALFFLDLDRFKLVNDTMGHSAGDELLRQVSRRLGRLAAEHPAATLARFGGDEFTLLLPSMTEEGQRRALAERLLHAIALPFDLQGNEVIVTGSVGVACWPADGEGIDEITRSCDTALHRAKELGRNHYCLFDESMRADAEERWRLENRLRQAIDANGLELYYQPRVGADGYRLAGFEALLRWHDPEFGAYMPADFVPIAEETGLIVPLGSWVLRRVAHQLRAWREQGLDVPFVSVNLSGRQLQPELVGEVRQILDETGVEAARLELEVTETAVIADAEQGIAVLEDLCALGIRVSLDDFGTGYSSLSYLRMLPISAVKIDGSFVRSIASDDQGLSLTSSIVSMAKVLGLFVVAEGVETEEQADLLTEMGCDELQGFLFGEPAPREDAERRLRERRRPRGAKRRPGRRKAR